MASQIGKRFQAIPNAEMSVIGWIIALGIGILLLPLAPFLVAAWLLSRLTEDESESDRPDRGG